MKYYKQTLIVILTMLFGFQTSHAQDISPWKEGKSGTQKYLFLPNDPLQTRFYTFPNGLKLIATVNKAEPRIHALVVVKAGSSADPATQTGLAHVLEHLLFKGTDKLGTTNWQNEKPFLDEIEALYESMYSMKDEEKKKITSKTIDSLSLLASRYAIGNEYDKLMSQIGSQGSNARTTFDATIYEENIPSTSLAQYITIQAERFRNPTFRTFQTELEVICEETNSAFANSDMRAWQSLHEALFQNHSYGQKSTLGTIEHLRNPSMKLLQEYYKTYYIPNNIAIILSGDFDPNDAASKIGEAFAYMKPEPTSIESEIPDAKLDRSISREVCGTSEESVTVGFRLPSVSHSKSLVLSTIVNDLLSNGRTGLLDAMNLGQSALNARSFLMSYKDYSMIVIQAAPNAGQSLEDIKGHILDKILILRRGKFDLNLITAGANNYAYNFLSGLDANFRRTDLLSSSYVDSNTSNWNEIVNLASNYSSVTKEEIVTYCNNYLENFAVVYTKKGHNPETNNVARPNISPISLNETAQSEFFNQITNAPKSSTEPNWIDFSKVIVRSKIGDVDVISLSNPRDELFKLFYQFDFGANSMQLLPIVSRYLPRSNTSLYTADELNSKLYDLGSNFHIDCKPESVTISITGLQKHFRRSVELIDHWFKNCQPNKDILHGLKKQIYQERINSKSNEDSYIEAVYNYAKYGPKNPFNNVISNSEIDTLKASTLTNLIRNLFNYQHRILYYGANQMGELQADLRTYHRTPAELIQVKHFTSAPLIIQDPKVVWVETPATQTHVMWVRNIGTFRLEDAPMIELFNNYFGYGVNSMVFKTIRESKGLAYSPWAKIFTPDQMEKPFTLQARVETDSQKMYEVINAMNELLRIMPESEHTFQLAKENIKTSLISNKTSKEGVLFLYQHLKNFGFETDYRKEAVELLETITIKDLAAFHDSSVANKIFTYCIIGSIAKDDVSGIQKLGEITKLQLHELFGY